MQLLDDDTANCPEMQQFTLIENCSCAYFSNFGWISGPGCEKCIFPGPLGGRRVPLKSLMLRERIDSTSRLVCRLSSSCASVRPCFSFVYFVCSDNSDFAWRAAVFGASYDPFDRLGDGPKPLV